MQSLFSCLVHPLVILGGRTLMRNHRLTPERGNMAAGEQREAGVMLYKVCRCGVMIPQTMKMCERCERRQQSRHVVYNNTRRDKRAAEFYLSKEWRAIRPVMMAVYDYIDIYALYELDELITLKDSDPIHHIVELEDDWNQRLNPLNLLPVSRATHNTITALYKQDKATMRATQTKIRQVISRHFEEAGGIEKVLNRFSKVGPTWFLGENSPREFQI